MILGAPGEILDALGGILEDLGGILEVSWECLGTILGSFRLCFGPILELGKHLRRDLLKL